MDGPIEEDDLYDSMNITHYVEKTADIYGNETYAEINFHRNNGIDPLDTLEAGKLASILILMPFSIAPNCDDVFENQYLFNRSFSSGIAPSLNCLTWI